MARDWLAAKPPGSRRRLRLVVLAENNLDRRVGSIGGATSIGRPPLIRINSLARRTT